MATPDLDIIKEIPGYKVILKAVLKSQIQQLVEQLASHTDEESVILTASVSDGTLSHLGSDSGKFFLDDHEDIKSQFLGFCLKRHHKQKTIEKALEKQKAPTMIAQPWSANFGPGQGPGIRTRFGAPNNQPGHYYQSLPRHQMSVSGKSVRHEPYPVSKSQRRSLDSSYESPKSVLETNSPNIKLEPQDSQQETANNFGPTGSQISRDTNIPNDKHNSDTSDSNQGVGDMNKSEIDSKVNVKVEAATDSELEELEITGVELGKNTDTDVAQNSGYNAQGGTGTPVDQQAQLPYSYDEMSRRWLCAICGKSFASKQNVNTHLRTHTGEKSVMQNDDKMTPNDDKSEIKFDQKEIVPTTKPKPLDLRNSNMSVKSKVGEEINENCNEMTTSVESNLNEKRKCSETPRVTGQKAISNDVSLDVISSKGSISKTQLQEPFIARNIQAPDEAKVKESISETTHDTKGKESISETTDETKVKESISETTDETKGKESISETTDGTKGKENTSDTNISVTFPSEVISNCDIHDKEDKTRGQVSSIREIDTNFTNVKDKQESANENCKDELPMETGGDVSRTETRNMCDSGALHTNTVSQEDCLEKMECGESTDSDAVDNTIKSPEDGPEKIEYRKSPDNDTLDSTTKSSEDCLEKMESFESLQIRKSLQNTAKSQEDIPNKMEIRESPANAEIDFEEDIDTTDYAGGNAMYGDKSGNSGRPSIIDKSSESFMNDIPEDDLSNSDVAASSNAPGSSPLLGTNSDETRCTSDTDLMGMYYSETGMYSDLTKDKLNDPSSDLLESPRNPNIIKLYVRKVCCEIIDELIENVCEQEIISKTSSNDLANTEEGTKENKSNYIKSIGKETIVKKGEENLNLNFKSTEVSVAIHEINLSRDNNEKTVQEPHEKFKMATRESSPTPQISDKSVRDGQELNSNEKGAFILDSETFKEKELRQTVLKTNKEEQGTAVTEVSSAIGDSLEKDGSTSNSKQSDRKTDPDTEKSNFEENTNKPGQIRDLWNKITGGTNTTNEELLGLLTQKLMEECSKASGTSVTEVPKQPPEQATSEQNKQTVPIQSDMTSEADKHNQSKTVVTGQTDTLTTPGPNEVQQSQEKSTCKEIDRNQQAKKNSDNSCQEKENKEELPLPKRMEGTNDKCVKSQVNTDNMQSKANNTDNALPTGNVRKDRQSSKDSKQPIVIDLEEQGSNTREKLQNQSMRRGEVTPVKQIPPGSSILNRTPPQSSLQSPSPRRGRGRPRKIIQSASPASTPNKKNFIENLIATGIPIIIPDDDDNVPQERSAEFKMKARKHTSPIMSSRQSHLMSPARSRDFQGFRMGSPPPAMKPRPIAPKPLSSPQLPSSTHFQTRSTPPRRQTSYDMQLSNQSQFNSGIINVTPSKGTRQLVGQMNQPQQCVGQSPQHQQLIIQSPKHSVQPPFFGQSTQQQFVRQSPNTKFISQSPQQQIVAKSQIQNKPIQSPQAPSQFRLIAPSPAAQPSVKRNISGTFVVIDDDAPASKQTTSSSNNSIGTPGRSNTPAAPQRNPFKETREPSLPIITNVHSIAQETDANKTVRQVTKTVSEDVRSELNKKVMEKVNIKKEPVDSYESPNSAKTVIKNVEKDKQTPKRELSDDKTKLGSQDENGPPLKRVKKEPGSEESKKSSNTNTPTQPQSSHESQSTYQETISEDERGSTTKDIKSRAGKGRKKSTKNINESPIIDKPLERKETISSPSKQKPQLELDIDLDDAENFRSGLSLEQVLQRMPSVHDNTGPAQDDKATRSSARRNSSKDVSDSEDPTSSKIPEASEINIKQEEEDSSSEMASLPKDDLSPMPFGCGDCGKTFSTKQSLSQHFKIHTREQPFECDVCGKHFSIKSWLKKHIYTHFKGKN